MDKLLCIEDVAQLLGRSPETIRKDIKRNPRGVPPLVRIPGCRLLRWRAEDVAGWVAAHVEREQVRP